MPTKKTKSGREYDINKGRWLVWHADVWEDEGETPFDVTLPLRLKAGILWEIGTDIDLDLGSTRKILEAVAPNAREQMADMDVNDLQEMFTTWQTEYNSLNGASLGEPSGSSS